jgi:mono/diheme cytochrome c family protein
MIIRVWAPVAVLFIAATFISGIALAGGPNPNRGKSLFRANCKSCHAPGGAAKDLTPLSKTQAQWTRSFKAQVPKMLPRVTQKTGQTLTPADLSDIQVFLVSHAADSDQPETCGIK